MYACMCVVHMCVMVSVYTLVVHSLYACVCMSVCVCERDREIVCMCLPTSTYMLDWFTCLHVDGVMKYARACTPLHKPSGRECI